MRKTNSHVPRVSRLLFRGFAKYSRRLITKRFCAMRVVRGTVPKLSNDERVLVYLNHVGWWDPLVAVMVAGEFLSPRQIFAPIDAAAVEKYSVMKRLGFFPVDQASPAGLRSFLETMQSVLNRPDTVVMITPQGRFVDVRDKQSFSPGLGHVVAGLDDVTIIPLACEYPFWDESTPEILLQFGKPIRINSGEPSHSKQQWTECLEQKLQSLQAELARSAIARDLTAFDTVISGRVGVGGLYDFARRMRSWFGGRRFEAAHGSVSASKTTAQGPE